MVDHADRESGDAARFPDDDGPSDRSLLRQVRHGDEEAARLLYHRYAHRLRALARKRRRFELAGRVDDDDIVQSVFGSFFRGVMHGSYDVPAGKELWHLFLAITLHKIHAKGVYFRAAKRDVRQTEGGDFLDESSDVLKTNTQAAAVLRLSIDEALGRLSEGHQAVIRLRMENREVEEIAGLVKRSKRSVERLLQESREALAKLFKADD